MGGTALRVALSPRWHYPEGGSVPRVALSQHCSPVPGSRPCLLAGGRQPLLDEHSELM